MNGAQALIRTLVNLGVEVCFMNPGTSELQFVGALDSVPEMRAVLALFEGVATGAADGYARIAGKPAATLLHLGPGLGNGIANLHNAKKARTPMVNVVGEHATYHREFKPPLSADIEGLASAVSKYVTTAETLDGLVGEVKAAFDAAVGAPCGIATIIVPADLTWTDGIDAESVLDGSQPGNPPDKPDVEDESRLQAAAEALRSGVPCTLFLGGGALSERGLIAASRLANAFGAKLLCETFPAVLHRGAGIPPIDRLGYLGEFAMMQLAGTKTLILVGAKDPVAFFAYPNKPSRYAPPDADVLVMCGLTGDAEAHLERLVELLGVSTTEPTIQGSVVPPLPRGPLTGAGVVAAIGALLPENAIVSDESITMGVSAPAATAGSPRHRWLTLTGGAIGQGMPLATGAAVAAPDCKVVNIQADGSALYTIQALWTQARENLDVTTVILNNQSYAILEFELNRVGAEAGGPLARSMLALSPPQIDFASIAKGFGVDAVSVSTGEDLCAQLERAFREPGPHLIEALLPKGIS